MDKPNTNDILVYMERKVIFIFIVFRSNMGMNIVIPKKNASMRLLGDLPKKLKKSDCFLDIRKCRKPTVGEESLFKTERKFLFQKPKG